ncbi:MAG: beta-1,4-N-acetylglucosaminyltransferase [Phenylobacterium sp.]|jgi:beta-1,4-N-acetylglucosaminyltransferase
MNILVTVGTSPFDALITAVDQQLSNNEHTITCQIASGEYQPSAHPFIRLSDQFEDLVDQADLVITHGGAATVFELLEAGKVVVLVPNLARIDRHQQDLAQFVESQGYACVCWSLDKLAQCVDRCTTQSFNRYHKEAFFMADDLLNYFAVAGDTKAS